MTDLQIIADRVEIEAPILHIPILPPVTPGSLCSARLTARPGWLTAMPGQVPAGTTAVSAGTRNRAPWVQSACGQAGKPMVSWCSRHWRRPSAAAETERHDQHTMPGRPPPRGGCAAVTCPAQQGSGCFRGLALERAQLPSVACGAPMGRCLVDRSGRSALSRLPRRVLRAQLPPPAAQQRDLNIRFPSNCSIVTPSAPGRSAVLLHLPMN
jgi:hypothetical protein